jgi:hypothetical protein
MWGSENWGEMVWAGDAAPIPMLEPAALIVLAAVLLIASVVVARRANAPH